MSNINNWPYPDDDGSGDADPVAALVLMILGIACFAALVVVLL